MAETEKNRQIRYDKVHNNTHHKKWKKKKKSLVIYLACTTTNNITPIKNHIYYLSHEVWLLNKKTNNNLEEKM